WHGHVVIKPALQRRAIHQLHARNDSLNRLGHHMRRAVADQEQRIGGRLASLAVHRGDDRKAGVVINHAREIRQFAIDLRADRRRECLACGKRFTTYERVEKTSRLAVVKKDGRREPFEATKVLAGIQSACGKRPISEEKKAALAQQVEEDLQREFDREVDSLE